MNENGILTFQLTITESREANLVREKLAISYEHSAQELDKESLLLSIYNRSRDVKDTISYTEFKKDILLQAMGIGEIPRNPRTGKISQVMDLRR